MKIGQKILLVGLILSLVVASSASAKDYKYEIQAPGTDAKIKFESIYVLEKQGNTFYKVSGEPSIIFNFGVEDGAMRQWRDEVNLLSASGNHAPIYATNHYDVGILTYKTIKGVIPVGNYTNRYGEIENDYIGVGMAQGTFPYNGENITFTMEIIDLDEIGKTLSSLWVSAPSTIKDNKIREELSEEQQIMIEDVLNGLPSNMSRLYKAIYKNATTEDLRETFYGESLTDDTTYLVYRFATILKNTESTFDIIKDDPKLREHYVDALEWIVYNETSRAAMDGVKDQPALYKAFLDLHTEIFLTLGNYSAANNLTDKAIKLEYESAGDASDLSSLWLQKAEALEGLGLRDEAEEADFIYKRYSIASGIDPDHMGLYINPNTAEGCRLVADSSAEVLGFDTHRQV
jgi:hypothetical protein